MKLVEMSRLFNITYGNKFDLNKMTRSEMADIAFVNRSGLNNGVVGYVNKFEDKEPYAAGILTIALGGSVLSTFLQVKPFYTGQNVAVATPKNAMTDAELLYYAAAIKANKFRYSTCGREANRTFKTMLVPDLSEVPVWVNGANVSIYDGADAPILSSESPALNTLDFKPFKLQSLFELRKGKRLTKANMISGVTPFIGSTDSGNGVTAAIGQDPIHKGNTISISYNGSVAEAFYQPIPYWATDDVNVLYPKFNMSPEIALFICAIIKREKYRFNYGRKWHLERMRSHEIKLPVKSDGSIDFDFIESYIQSLPYSSQISNNQTTLSAGLNE